MSKNQSVEHLVGRKEPTPQITVVIPTRNESENIQPLLAQLAASLSRFSIEAIFVDDSTDGTADVIRLAAADNPFPVRLIARPPAARNGLSGAVVDGFRAAHGDWICVMDADLQHPPATIVRMWDQAEKSGADIVVGSRQGDLLGPYGLSRLRSLNSQLLTLVARTLFPRRLKNASDPLTGLFLVRRSAIDITSLRPEGFKILLEILVRHPALQVSEVHFKFAPRHSGESKADVREGARFFRHLLTLRTTANPHLGRFIVLLIAALLGNTFLLVLLLSLSFHFPLLFAFLTAEVTWLAIFFGLEYWVFSERTSFGRRRRFWGFFFLTQGTIFTVYLPLFYVLNSLIGIDAIAANLVTFVVVGLVRYLLSEQWVWTRGAIAWQVPSYYYNLHGILQIESQVPLHELTYFASTEALEEVDLHIRVDRQGTPSALSGGISYDDQLGRFGFGLTVLPGNYTQIVVSPLLEHSPDFLFTNVVEPVLRWRLVALGYALAKSACIARDNGATLISAEGDLGYVVSRLCTQFGFQFMSDDLTIINADGIAYCYPKPVTVDRAMLSDSEEVPSLGKRAIIGIQRALYTRYARRFGLWLSMQDIPAATINTYLQRFIPQPKLPLEALYPRTVTVDQAPITSVVFVESLANETSETLEPSTCLQQRESVAAFQPLPLLAQNLRTWSSEDLLLKEQAIISDALEGVPQSIFPAKSAEWWHLLAQNTEQP